jgi:hypothetical protein
MVYSSAPKDYFSNSSSSSERQDRNYVLEIEWLSGDTTKHESLSPTQASLRLREFEQEVKSAWSSLPDAQKPRRARILDPWGNTEREVAFPH